VAEHNEQAALPFDVFCRIAHAHGLPVLVDHAAEIPPASNLRKYSDLGADLVVISGGKGLHGPQCAGLILGRKDLIAACAANSSPHAAIGRPLKVGKEELCGMVAALELYLTEISHTERDQWERMVAFMVASLQGIPQVQIRRHFPYRPTREVPVMVVELAAGARLTAAQVVQQLQEGEPPIYVPVPKSGFGYPPGQGFIVNPHTMLMGEEQHVARRLREILVSA
jgi:L-seryl-tRNA(Ser) seleniumtransferase